MIQIYLLGGKFSNVILKKLTTTIWDILKFCSSKKKHGGETKINKKYATDKIVHLYLKWNKSRINKDKIQEK